MITFIRQHQSSLFITVLSIIFGSVIMGTAYLTTLKESETPPLSRTRASASGSSCTLSFPVYKATTGETAPTSVGCIGLSVIPLSGSSPLTVTFFAYGQAVEEALAQAIFFFGDGEQAVVSEVGERGVIVRRTATHIYKMIGDYQASVQFVSKNGIKSSASDFCTVLIRVLP